LIDTHVLIARTEDRMSDLGPKIARLVSDPGNTLFVSAASLWEIAIKVRIGKLSSTLEPPALIAYVERVGMQLLPVTPLHAVTVVAPEPATRDPFDRMLLAQCLVEGLRLATIDRALADHPLSAVT
jgi:PIN domain nuclease of toxin-antitoxin system